jgi:glycosyltransferase involved in cell wall biosynthesis
MRIVHTYGLFVPSLAEGISRNIDALARAQRAAGHDARLDAAPTPWRRLNRKRQLLLGGLEASRRARRALADPEVDAVHFHVGLPSMAAFARRALRGTKDRRRLVVHAWNAHREGATPGVPWADRAAHAVANGPLAARLGTAGLPDLVVSSRYQARQLRRPGGPRVHVVPNGVDAARFRPRPEDRDQARARLGVGGDPLVLYYGHLSPWKGVDVLLRAMPALLADHPGARLVVAATPYGGQAARLRRDAQRLGLDGKVHWLGLCDVTLLHAAADVAAVPARAGVGTACYPNVLLECMAAGLAVVATRAGAVPEVVAPGRSGLLARPGDPADLAEQLLAVAGDPARRRALGAEARGVVLRRHGWDQAAAALAPVYAMPGPDGAPQPEPQPWTPEVPA